MACWKKSFSCMAAAAVLAATSPASAQFGQQQAAPPQNGQLQPGQAQPGQAQAGQPQAAPTPQQAPTDVIAKVNGEPIMAVELQTAMQPQLQSGQVPPEQVPQLQQKVLNSLVEGRLVEQHVIEKGPKVEEQEVKQVIDQYQGQLESQGMKLDDYLAMRGLSKDGFERRVQGSIGWQKLQQQELTEENLQAHFQENQQQFGTNDFNQARQQVATSYVGKLWGEIIAETGKDAKIEVMEPSAPTNPNDVFGAP